MIISIGKKDLKVKNRKNQKNKKKEEKKGIFYFKLIL